MLLTLFELATTTLLGCQWFRSIIASVLFLLFFTSPPFFLDYSLITSPLPWATPHPLIFVIVHRIKTDIIKENYSFRAIHKYWGAGTRTHYTLYTRVYCSIYKIGKKYICISYYMCVIYYFDFFTTRRRGSGSISIILIYRYVI